jgi:hypothetical protein
MISEFYILKSDSNGQQTFSHQEINHWSFWHRMDTTVLRRWRSRWGCSEILKILKTEVQHTDFRLWNWSFLRNRKEAVLYRPFTDRRSANGNDKIIKKEYSDEYIEWNPTESILSLKEIKLECNFIFRNSESEIVVQPD